MLSEEREILVETVSPRRISPGGKKNAPERCRVSTDPVHKNRRDVMPTLLSLCGIEIPQTVEGIDLLHESRNMLYGEIGEGRKATRMATDGRYKLIYYPCGNVFQLFDTVNDPGEHHNLANMEAVAEIQTVLTAYLVEHLHGDDVKWLKDGKLIGIPAGEFVVSPDYELYNQRGLHWPAPSGYQNAGRT